jgi:uncharacterized iron-regulated protein
MSACTPTTTQRARHPAEPTAPTERLPWLSKLALTHRLVGVIWDVAARRAISESELTARVQLAPILLLGETHDNPDHHRIQAELLSAFAVRHDMPVVVFEMLDRRQQTAVDASLHAHPGDVDALAQAMDWASSGWPDWWMYRPVFEAAVRAHAKILAGGLDRAVAMQVAHEGPAAFDPSLDHEFGLSTPLPPDAQADVRQEMRESHCGLLPETMLDSMGLVQRVRDALMAERLREGASNHQGALLVAGAGHVRRDRGVPALLARAGLPAVAIGLLEVRAEVTTPEGYAQAFNAQALPFDYVWFTPRANDTDHCAELRAQMNAHDASPGGRR